MINKTGDSGPKSEDALDLVRLINKEMREELSQKEEEKKAFLLTLLKSGK